MNDVIEANKRKGFHFFDEDTKRFFRSRIGGRLYGDRYFITSEQFHNNMTGQTDARKYTIREFHKDTCQISEVGEFQQYDTHAQAAREIERLLKARADHPTCEYCGKVRDENKFVIGASLEKEWVMHEGTGKMSCPECWERAKKEAEDVLKKL